MAKTWYEEEKNMYGSNGKIFAYNSYTEEYERTFESYDELRAEWPGAEIVGHEMLEPGCGCIVYC